MEATNTIDRIIEESVRVKQSFSDELKNRIHQVVEEIALVLQKGKTVYILGNGGSAADAQHFSAELVGRFLKERQPLDVHALTTNCSTLTCLINDYPPEELFARQVQAHARTGDLVIGISTSGRSTNIVKALQRAKEQGARTVGMTGEQGRNVGQCCDILLNVPSSETPRIQEAHVLIVHMICELVEDLSAEFDA